MKTIGVTGEFTRSINLQPLDGFSIVTLVPNSYTDIEKFISTVDYYILGGPEYLSRELLSSAKSLKAVAVMGTGTPSFIDVNAATELGIAVYNVPSQNAEAVAEFAYSVLYLSQARIFHSIEVLKQKAFWFQSPRPSFQDSKFGIIGLGACAKALVARLQSSGVSSICYYSRTRDFEFERTHKITYKPFASLLIESDLVSVHVSLNSDSENLIDEEALKACKPSLQLFNFSNPKVVNAQALKAALEDRLDFFYLDGYYQEWVDIIDDPQGLLSLPARKFVATSHIAAQLTSTVDGVFHQALQHILAHNMNSL